MKKMLILIADNYALIRNGMKHVLGSLQGGPQFIKKNYDNAIKRKQGPRHEFD